MSQTYYIVTQVKSNRVVYFTTDSNYQAPQEEDLFFVSSYKGALPAEISLSNCWRWRFNGGVFFDADKEVAPRPTAEQALIDHNRQALRKLLQRKVNNARNQFSPGLDFWFTVLKQRASEAEQLLQDETRASDLPFLQDAAVANSWTMRKAAEVYTQQDRAFMDALRNSERIHDHYTLLINSAKTESELQKIRADILENVTPETSRFFTTDRDNAVPVNEDAEIEGRRLAAEKARLNAHLGDRIRSLRTEMFLGERLDETSRQVLVGAANTQSPAHQLLLEAYAKRAGVAVDEIRRRILAENAAIEASHLHLETKRIEMLERIRCVKTERQLNQVSREIWNVTAKAQNATH